MPGPRSLLACALLALAASGIGAASAGAHEGPLEITPLFVIPAASGNSFDDAGVAPLAVPAAPDLMAAAHAVAAAHWGVDPCAGAWTESWQHLGATMNAESRWMATDQADPATYSSCSIAYSLDVDWNWPKLCTIVEHELGHLTGHGHVADPTNVMSPYYVQPSPDCAATPQPGATPAPGTAPAPAAASTAAVASAATRKAKRIKAKRRARAARTRKASARR